MNHSNKTSTTTHCGTNGKKWIGSTEPATEGLYAKRWSMLSPWLVLDILPSISACFGWTAHYSKKITSSATLLVDATAGSLTTLSFSTLLYIKSFSLCPHTLSNVCLCSWYLLYYLKPFPTPSNISYSSYWTFSLNLPINVLLHSFHYFDSVHFIIA